MCPVTTLEITLPGRHCGLGDSDCASTRLYDRVEPQIGSEVQGLAWNRGWGSSHRRAGRECASLPSDLSRGTSHQSNNTECLFTRTRPYPSCPSRPTHPTGLRDGRRC